MKPTALLRAGAIAIAFVMSGGAARAGVITLDVSATMIPSNSLATCSPACILGGDIVINNAPPAPGTIVSADVTATGFLINGSPADAGPFTNHDGISANGSLTVMQITDQFGDLLLLSVSTPTAGSLVGYMGGPLDTSTNLTSNIIPAIWNVSSGSLTPAAVPEPSSLLLLSALAGLGGVLYTRRRLGRTAPHAL
ncbi:MAG: PEP-CTERM sorting domain-containing protein [Stellaceae bacterium]